MPLNIKNPHTYALARELAEATGESVTEAVQKAIEDRLQQIKKEKRHHLADELDAIALECAALPRKDLRSDDDIIGYDENGLPS